MDRTVERCCSNEERAEWVSTQARVWKCKTEQLRLASADEEATADLTPNDDMRGLTGADKKRKFFESGRRGPGLPEPAPRAAPQGIGFSRRDRIESILDSSTSVCHRRQFQDTQAGASLSLEEPELAQSSVTTSQSQASRTVGA